MGGIRNELRWSKSRGVVFHECLRKYFLRYYQSWEGWKSGAPESVRKAYTFSKMMTMATMAGQAVHRALARHLHARRRGEPATIDAEEAVNWMRVIWKDTESKLYLKNPKRHPPLMEVYYNDVPPAEKRQQYADRVRTCLTNFARLDLGDPADWVWIERDDDQFEPRTIFQIEWDEAFGSPDFVRRAGRRLEIYDWKTGTETPEDEIQVTVYAAWALEQLEADAAAIDGRLVYLNDGARVEPVSITPHDIESVRTMIVDELGQMKERLVDVQTNTPQPMNEFRMTEDRELCKRCEFRGLCFP